MDRCHKDLSGPHFLIPVDFLLTISCASLFLVQTTNLNSACIHGDKHTDSWFLHRDVIIDCTNVKLGVLVRLLFGPFINSGLTSIAANFSLLGQPEPRLWQMRVGLHLRSKYQAGVALWHCFILTPENKSIEPPQV